MSVLRAFDFDIDYLVGKFSYCGLSSIYLFPSVLKSFFFVTNVIGILTGVGIERELNRTGSSTKLNIISIEADG